MEIFGQEIKEYLHEDAQYFAGAMDDRTYLHKVAAYIDELESEIDSLKFRLESLEK